MLSLALVGTDETGLRPDGSTVNPELTCQRVHADALRAGCSHGVHFAVREACSRSFTWFRRRADQRIVRLSDRLGILPVSLIPRGSQPLNPRSPVPVVLHCVHNFRPPRRLTSRCVRGARETGLTPRSVARRVAETDATGRSREAARVSWVRWVGRASGWIGTLLAPPRRAEGRFRSATVDSVEPCGPLFSEDSWQTGVAGRVSGRPHPLLGLRLGRYLTPLMGKMTAAPIRAAIPAVHKGRAKLG